MEKIKKMRMVFRRKIRENGENEVTGINTKREKRQKTKYKFEDDEGTNPITYDLADVK